MINPVTDTWYVLADGAHADPSEVSAGKDGVLRHKNGVPVALREGGLPLTSGVATKENKKATEAAKPAGAEGDKAPSDDKAAPKSKNREVKPSDDKAADGEKSAEYKTR